MLRDQAFELIRSLIDQIILTPENGASPVDIKGDFAGILDLCASAQGRPDAIGKAWPPRWPSSPYLRT